MTDFLYRFEDSTCIESDDFDLFNDCSNSNELDGFLVRLYAYPIKKETPCGCWISVWGEKKKFVLNNTHKKFAARTIEEAKISYLKRKEKQVAILETKLSIAKRYLKCALIGKFNTNEIKCY